MENVLKQYRYKIGPKQTTPFCAKNNIYQDGTTPVFRDTDGKLWAISGHSHVGEIAMFCGTNMHNLKKQYPIKTNFMVGAAKKAFNGIKYPEGIDSRGSVWPFGLYICPKTHRFFAFFHNETGWAGQKTAYDAIGLCETPYLDSDFRHIGLMHSDDEGRTWSFDRWVLSAETVCFSQKYNPNQDVMIGQPLPSIRLGSGDFSMYIDEDYLYIFYNIIQVNLKSKITEKIDVYVARSRRREDGVIGDFVKYYNGAFCEAGNFGKETPIVLDAWHAKVNKLVDAHCYVMSSTKKVKDGTYNPNDGSSVIERQIQLRVSLDLISWSEPFELKNQQEKFGDHYCAFYSSNDHDCHDITGNKLILQLNGNGTDVFSYDVEILKK